VGSCQPLAVSLYSDQMDNIENIKSGTFKEYFGTAIFGGLILGIIFFLINLIENNFLTALYRGLGTSFSIVTLLFTFGYFHEEWYLRRQRIQLLKSDKYLALQKIGLTLNNDLDFVGYIDNYFIRFMTNEKWAKKNSIIFHSIDIYSKPKNFDQLRILIDKVKRMRNIKNAAWGYGIFTAYFTEDTQRFDELVVEIITTLRDFNLQPIEMTAWEKSFGNDLRQIINVKENQKTKQLLKIGKLDIKYKKP
jgi:hypothetical protein